MTKVDRNTAIPFDTASNKMEINIVTGFATVIALIFLSSIDTTGT